MGIMEISVARCDFTKTIATEAESAIFPNIDPETVGETSQRRYLNNQ